jgi:hypothetical protein
VLDLLRRLQVALGGLAGGVADHPGGAAGEGDRVVAEELEAAQRQQRDQVADVEGVGRGVEAAVKRNRALLEAGAERNGVGAVGEEAAPAQLIEDIHAGPGSKRRAGRRVQVRIPRRAPPRESICGAPGPRST